MKTMLISENIKRKFGEQEVVKGINLTIAENTFTAILGLSGLGKSTLLNILSGLNRPTSGTVRSRDMDISALSEAKLADWKRRNVGNIFQNYPLLNHLTVEENIRIGISPGQRPLSFDPLFCDEAIDALDEADSKNVVELLHLLKIIFNSCIITAYSLNIRGEKVFASQTEGHNYE